MKLLSNALAASPLLNAPADSLNDSHGINRRLPLLPSTAEGIKKRE